MKEGYTNYEYPLLKKLFLFFKNNLTDKQKDWLKKNDIVTCQHLLEPQKKMFELMVELGVQPKNIHILGKIYSTNFEILKELKDLGFDVFQPDFNLDNSFDDQHKNNCKKLIKSQINKEIVVLDDGAELISTCFNESLNIKAVEQTSSGYRKIETLDLNFPVINVARSSVKLVQETPFVVDLGVRRMKEQLDIWNLMHPNILIVGQGPIGFEMFNQLNSKFNTFVYDKNSHDENLIDVILENNIDLIIGATGSQILDHDELIHLSELSKKDLYFISMSSSDREFDLWKMRDVFKPISIHSEVTYNNIHIANNGFPITFKGNRNESKPQEIEKTICLLFGSTIHMIINNISEKGILSVPEYIVDILEN